jgi:hypothetical protein
MRRKRVLLATVVPAVVAALALVSGGAGNALGAGGGLASHNPLLLLEADGWRVQNVGEFRSRRGVEGNLEFVTGKPIPYETVKILGTGDREREQGMFPPATRQRRVELHWRLTSLADAVKMQRASLHPHGQHWVELPVDGTTAKVDTRAEFYANQGGPGNRTMKAFWTEGGHLIELEAAVPDQAAFEERLEWVTKVSQSTWLAAMPAKVVKTTEYASTVKEMLRDIPTPKTFKPSRVPNEGLVTDRYQVGAQTAGTVACLWFRQWGAAQRSGDEAAAAEAVKAMATSRHWSILREMTAEGDYPYVLWEDAKWMPKGYYEWHGHKRDLLAQAEGLGCARKGLPLTPEKMRIQRERGKPGPPR